MKTNYLKRSIQLSIPIFAITLSVLLMTRCSNELISDTQEEEVTEFGESPILQFNSSDEFMAKAQKTISLTLEELRAEEEAEDYVSFGRIADEIYDEFLEKNFTSREQIEAFVEKHSDYLQLIVGEDGEEDLVSRFYNNPFRYLMNKDRMFQLQGKVFKQFENGVASVSTQDVDELMKINAFSYESKNSNIEFIVDKSTTIQKTTYANKSAMNCGSIAGQTVTNGHHRTILEIKIQYQEFIPGSINMSGYWLVRPRKKALTFGPWVNVKKYIRGYVNMVIDYNFDGLGWNTKYITNSVDAYHAYKWEGSSPIGIGENPQSHFDGYFAFGDTGSTDPAAEVQCNKSTVCVGPGPVFPSLCPEANPAPPGGGGGEIPCDPLDPEGCPPGYDCVNGDCVFDNGGPACNGGGPCPPGYACVNYECIEMAEF